PSSGPAPDSPLSDRWSRYRSRAASSLAKVALHGKAEPDPDTRLHSDRPMRQSTARLRSGGKHLRTPRGLKGKRRSARAQDKWLSRCPSPRMTAERPLEIDTPEPRRESAQSLDCPKSCSALRDSHS